MQLAFDAIVTLMGGAGDADTIVHDEAVDDAQGKRVRWAFLKLTLMSLCMYRRVFRGRWSNMVPGEEMDRPELLIRCRVRVMLDYERNFRDCSFNGAKIAIDLCGRT
jgi:hypothetical protein